MELEGRAAIVTGAGTGVGRATALALARRGCSVLVNYSRSKEGAEKTAAEALSLGVKAIPHRCDVADDAECRALVETAVAAFGRLDALVNNAATEFRGTLEEHTPAQWDRVMAVNARGTLNCVRHAIPVMRRQGAGSIVNTTSGAFWDGTESTAAYAASKAAIFSLTLSQHTELSPQGITSNCIAPNATRTRLLDSWVSHLRETSDLGEEEVAAQWGIQPPENLAPLAIFLCSEAARGISGHVFEVWGDRIHLMRPPTRDGHVERGGGEWQPDRLAEGLIALTRPRETQ